MGCSDAASTAPARRRTSASLNGVKAIAESTDRCPLVTVPVLSSRMVSTVRVSSRTCGPLMRMPSWAPRPVPVSSPTGVARPSAHGHAITSTATAAVNAERSSGPVTSGPAASSQAAKVRTAMAKTIGTNTALIRSASRAIGAFPVWASATSRPIWASVVSAPTRVARTSSRPAVLMVAPVTGLPGPTSTGTDSPVTSEASTAEEPLITTPSVAIFSPGRTTTTSSTASWSAGIFTSAPLTSTVASLAPRFSSAFRASPALALAFASRNRPSSRKVVTTAATSKYRPPEPAPPICSMPGCSVRRGSARSCQAEKTYAASTPRDTSVSIVEAKCRAWMAAARWKGHAAQLTTGKARAAGHPAPVRELERREHRDEEDRDRQDGRRDQARLERLGRAAVCHVVALGDATGDMLCMLARASPPAPSPRKLGQGTLPAWAQLRRMLPHVSGVAACGSVTDGDASIRVRG